MASNGARLWRIPLARGREVDLYVPPDVDAVDIDFMARALRLYYASHLPREVAIAYITALPTINERDAWGAPWPEPEPAAAAPNTPTEAADANA